MIKLNPHQAQRLFYILTLLLGLTLAAGLILYSLKQNINLFFTPSQALQAQLPANHHFRLGGQVKRGSIIRSQNKELVYFVLTDLKQDIKVRYHGILPDLFREGKGAIADGHWNPELKNEFIASELLAKHDENYQPQQMIKALQTK